MWAMKTKKSADADWVREGSVFHVARPGNLVETATVMSVNADSAGIPHVRFRFSIGRSDNQVFEEGPRVLALSCFAKHYNVSHAS